MKAVVDRAGADRGGGFVYEGTITQGGLVALVNYMSQILVELIKLANLIITITKAAACARRIEALTALTVHLFPKEREYFVEMKLEA